MIDFIFTSQTIHDCILPALICMFAAFVQGTSGFGSALVAMPLLVMIMPAKVATPLCVLMGTIITTDLTIRLRHHVDIKTVGIFTAGCIPGIAAGVYLLGNFDDELMRRLLGIVLASYASWALFIKLPVLNLSKAWGGFAGFAAGMLGASLSTGGPPVIVYCSLLGWSRDRMKATLSAFFLVASIIIVTAHFFGGFITGEVLEIFAVSALPVLVGTWAGTALYNRMSHHTYIRLLLTLLLMAGLLLVIS